MVSIPARWAGAVVRVHKTALGEAVLDKAALDKATLDDAALDKAGGARMRSKVTAADIAIMARISAAAHGGQVILSAQTMAALELAEGITLRDLGSYRFAGLPRDEILFQLVAEGLAADFPPLRMSTRSG